MEERYSKIVELLDSEHLGIKSRIGQNDWSLVTTKLAMLEKAGLWEQALEFTRGLLSLPAELAEDGKNPPEVEEKDDWQVWNIMLTAAEKLPAQE